MDLEHSKLDVDEDNTWLLMAFSAASNDAYQRVVVLVLTSGFPYEHALPLVKIDPKTPIPRETHRWLIRKPVEEKGRIVAGWNPDNFHSDDITLPAHEGPSDSNDNTGTEKRLSLFRERISMVTQSDINNERDQNVSLDSESETDSAPDTTEADHGQLTARLKRRR